MSCESTIFFPESGCTNCTAFEQRLRAVENTLESVTSQLQEIERVLQGIVGGSMIPISITDANGNTTSVRVYGEVLS